MAKQQLGTKRICPETGKKFYDLGRDPVVSPYTGISYPVSAFDLTVKKTTKPDEEPQETDKDEAETAEVEAEDTGDVEVVSLEDAEPKGSLDDDDEDDDNADVIPDIDTTDIDGDDAVNADDDTFLEDDDEDSDPAVAVVAGRDDDDT
ncbi:TIGR02300 family protein [Ahrensia marina]|uniref:TIGR02300 family protein n=1 Tax=Ahrensia marina TaxID=1514904 RepID=UPI0035CEDD9E